MLASHLARDGGCGPARPQAEDRFAGAWVHAASDTIPIRLRLRIRVVGVLHGDHLHGVVWRGTSRVSCAGGRGRWDARAPVRVIAIDLDLAIRRALRFRFQRRAPRARKGRRGSGGTCGCGCGCVRVTARGQGRTRTLRRRRGRAHRNHRHSHSTAALALALAIALAIAEAIGSPVVPLGCRSHDDVLVKERIEIHCGVGDGGRAVRDSGRGGDCCHLGDPFERSRVRVRVRARGVGRVRARGVGSVRAPVVMMPVSTRANCSGARGGGGGQ